MSTNKGRWVKVGDLTEGDIVIAHNNAGNPLVIKIVRGQSRNMRCVDVSMTTSCTSGVRTSTLGCTVRKEVLLCTDKATTLYFWLEDCSAMPIYGVRLDRVLHPGDGDYQKADELFRLPSAARDLLNEQSAHTA